MIDATPAAAVHRRAGARWCLFLDRDGVINDRILDGYVRTWDDFVFAPGAREAIAELSTWAPRIVVVTNQQGVGKGLMSLADLDDIHERMRAEISAASGRIDEVLFCPHLATDDCTCRKPSPAMAKTYLDDHPELDASLSVMVGDTAPDVEMGVRLAALTGGCLTVRIDAIADPLADLTFPSLAAFAAGIRAAQAATAGQSLE